MELRKKALSNYRKSRGNFLLIFLAIVLIGLVYLLVKEQQWHNDQMLVMQRQNVRQYQSILVQNHFTTEVLKGKLQPETREIIAEKFGLIGVEIGQTAFDFVLLDNQGQRVHLSSLRGQPVVIDFWAAVCPFCNGDVSFIELFHNLYPEVAFLGVHRTDIESKKIALDFMKKQSISYQALWDEQGSVYFTYSEGLPIMPVTYFIDKNGVIREKIYGVKTEEEIRAGLAKIMDKE
ncbi:TlpA family protein disulfide reductase [Patescibacteria group bacterium]